MKKYILVMDSGTSSVRSIIFNLKGDIVAMAQRELQATYPNVGWVEQNPNDIWAYQIGTMNEVMVKAKVSYNELISIGITNQRETTIAWNKETGMPVYNAIVWQDRRTSEYCKKLAKDSKFLHDIKSKTGLVIDSYFSGTKMKWILDNVKEAKHLQAEGKLLFGTVDTWLMWNLTGGKTHATDYTNASRTLISDINKLKWDDSILKEFGIKKDTLPEVKFSDADYGKTLSSITHGEQILITGVVGDQQSSLFGHYGVNVGDFKATFGTGTFMLQNIGSKFKLSKHGLITTIGTAVNGKISYAFEGAVFTSGTVLKWVKDSMRIIYEYEQVDYYAKKRESNDKVYFVPAFNGLGSPYWKPYAKGMIIGIDADTKRGDIVKAAIEGIGFQLKDLVDAFMADSSFKSSLNVDGGLTNSEFFMQFLSDISDLPVVKQKSVEITAQGSFFISLLGSDTVSNVSELKKLAKVDSTLKPKMKKELKERIINGWKVAMQSAILYSDNLEKIANGKK